MINKRTNKQQTEITGECEERVELHCHTKMSEMDGLTDPENLSEGQSNWGTKLLPSQTAIVCRHWRRQ